ncbi:Pseudouridine-5'-phosphate glycosidase [subsurface metagenome]
MDFQIEEKIEKALNKNKPIVAMESTLFVHGLPKESSIKLFRKLKGIAKKEQVNLAIIAILNGVLKIGITDEQIISLIEKNSLNLVNKAGTRDISFNIALKRDAATTVSSTLWAAQKAGIKVMATGGIGGVHREILKTLDISADIYALSKHNLIVVCSGPKAFLDIKNTFELLESLSIPVVGYKNSYFATFFCGVDENLELKYVLENAKEIAEVYLKMRDLGMKQSLLVSNPILKEYELDKNLAEKTINQVLRLCKEKNIKGHKLSPFILKNLAELTDGKSLKSNLALIKGNFKLACQISKEL